MKYTVAIVDDEHKNLEILAYYIASYCPQLEVVAQLSTRKSAIKYLKANPPQILFLDIVLDEGSGFDVLDAFDYSQTQIVFCTAHDEYALKAFRYQAHDYQLKPIEIKDLINTADTVIKKINANTYPANDAVGTLKNQFHSGSTKPKRVKIVRRTKVDFVKADDIVFCQALPGSKSEYHTIDDQVLYSNQSLVELNTILDKSIFFKISRSYIINMNHLSEIDKNVSYSCVMSNHARLPITRSKYKELLLKIDEVFNI
jgi:two-component system LytT family response regulator